MQPLRLILFTALVLGSLASAVPHHSKHHHHTRQQLLDAPLDRIRGSPADETNDRTMGVGPEVKGAHHFHPYSVDGGTDNPTSHDGDHQPRLSGKRFLHGGPHQKAMTSLMRVKSRAKRDGEAPPEWPFELGNNKSKNNKKPDGGDGGKKKKPDGGDGSTKNKSMPDKNTPPTKPDKTTPTAKPEKANPTTKPDKDQTDSSDDPDTTTTTPTTNTTNTNTTSTSTGKGTTSGASSSCTFSDVGSLDKGKGSCSKIVIQDMKVPAGKTLDLSQLANGSEVVFAGTTTFGYQQWEGPLVRVWRSPGIKISGASGSVLDMNGAQYWDGKGGHGGAKKPRAFAIDGLTSSTISGLTLKNTPEQAFSVGTSTGLVLDSNVVDNADGIKGGGHNQDGFDVAHCTQCTISNNKVTSTDDCVAVNSGEAIKVVNNVCVQSHGLAAAPLPGSKINGLLFQGNTLSGSLFALRIKASPGESATVNDVRFIDNTFENVEHSAVEISQSYSNDHKYADSLAGDSAPFTTVVFSGNKGSVASTGSKMEVNCGSGSCQGFTWESNEITGGGQPSVCKNPPKSIPCGQS